MVDRKAELWEITDIGRARCFWCQGSEDYVTYHDTEWGVPVHDDRLLFEYLTLEGAQAGETKNGSIIMFYRAILDHYFEQAW